MFDIDLRSRTPIYEQLYKRVVELTVKNQLTAGDKLPSVRELAKELGVNPNTVSKAFGELERDGIIYSVPGRGSFIAEQNGGIIKKNAEEDFERAVKEAASAGLLKPDMLTVIDKFFGTEGKENEK